MYDHVVETRTDENAPWTRHTERMTSRQIVAANKAAGWLQYRLPPVSRYADQVN